MSLRKMLLRVVFLAMTLPTSTQASVELVTISAFGTPRVLDMQAHADGPIANTDALFSDFGITSITGAAAVPGPDGYNGGTPFDRALFHSNANGLMLVSYGAAPWFDRSPTFTIVLEQTQWLFGIAPVDTLGDLRIRFKRAGIEVGELTFHSDRVSTYYFHSSEAFDEVVLDQPTLSDGWGIDNLTLDNALMGDPHELPIVPLTGALTGTLLGCAGAWNLHRKRARSHPG